MESWYTDNCPKCYTLNWWCNGDESDMTQCDIEGVKCWNCKKVWSLEDRKLVKEDAIYFADGQNKH
jgi:hypothetical protein